jgi:transcription elongation factor GreA
MQRYPMTKNGAMILEQELNNLKTYDRPEVIKAIAEARSHGDLSENAEYDAAKNKQAFIEGRIAELEAKLSLAQIIDPSQIEQSDKIIFGATVDLFDLETEKKIKYQIVGDDESNLKLGKISINSPVAKSLIGKEIGNIVEVKAPGGNREYEILNFYF